MVVYQSNEKRLKFCKEYHRKWNRVQKKAVQRTVMRQTLHEREGEQREGGEEKRGASSACTRVQKAEQSAQCASCAREWLGRTGVAEGELHRGRRSGGSDRSQIAALRIRSNGPFWLSVCEVCQSACAFPRRLCATVFCRERLLYRSIPSLR